MIQIGRKEFGISGFAIRLLGVITMIMAGIGYVKGYGFDWLEAFGWTSFTLFAFLLVEGLAHSTNLHLYFRRFVLFTLISQVVYSFYRTQKFWSWKFFNVMVTLLVGLIIMAIVKYVHKKQDNIVLDLILIFVLGYIAYIFTKRYNFDFGGFGIIIILGMFVAREVTYTRITQILVLLYICFYLSNNVLTLVKIGGIQYPIAPELFSIAALPFIWLYDDNRGPNSIGIQIIQYAAYPVFIIIMAIFKLYL